MNSANTVYKNFISYIKNGAWGKARTVVQNVDWEQLGSLNHEVLDAVHEKIIAQHDPALLYDYTMFLDRVVNSDRLESVLALGIMRDYLKSVQYIVNCVDFDCGNYNREQCVEIGSALAKKDGNEWVAVAQMLTKQAHGSKNALVRSIITHALKEGRRDILDQNSLAKDSIKYYSTRSYLKAVVDSVKTGQYEPGLLRDIFSILPENMNIGAAPFIEQFDELAQHKTAFSNFITALSTHDKGGVARILVRRAIQGNQVELIQFLTQDNQLKPLYDKADEGPPIDIAAKYGQNEIVRVLANTQHDYICVLDAALTYDRPTLYGIGFDGISQSKYNDVIASDDEGGLGLLDKAAWFDRIEFIKAMLDQSDLRLTKDSQAQKVRNALNTVTGSINRQNYTRLAAESV